MWDEALQALHNEEYNQDAEKRAEERANTEEPLLMKTMGADFDKFFGTDEQHEKHLWDAKHAL